ncbi:cytochrome P450 2J4-like [Amphiura filiformis]|uniref:cytochrome P450 2J4-like n=1 Tax=Amphiura filiformis TaxID=82378 RepID=UPI003B21D943
MLYFEFFLSYVNTQTILAFIVVYLLLSYGFRRHKWNLPPGPWSLPILGNLPMLAIYHKRIAEKPGQWLAEIAKDYGEVFSLKVGTKLIVVANGCKSIKEAFRNQHISDRPRSKVFEETDLDEAVGFTSGKSWKYQRTFTFNTFRTFGVGRSRFEGNITKEAETLVDGMRDNNNKEIPFNPHVLLGNCVSNVISSVVLGKRYDHSDPEFKRLVLLVNKNANNIGPGALVVFLPMAKYVFPNQYQIVKSNSSEFSDFILGVVHEHRQHFDEDNIHDIIDVYLKEIELSKKEQSDRAEYIHLRSLIATTTFLFLAGTETTATTLRWALLYMIKYPEIQAKVQQEMDAVVGRTRMPQWADRLSLSYTGAVLLEIQRNRAVVTLGLPHVASEDTKLAGYDIPKGTYVVSNIWAVHHDPDVWAEPDQFKPERFLDKDGKLRQREELMPFSTGHRMCLGENLAKMEMFLFFTYILHSFILTKPDAKPISMEGVSGGTFSPKPYEIVVKDRN